MSWADDRRCGYCGAKLPLRRKVRDGQFCSDAHQRSFRFEQEQLALQRLHDVHDSLYPGSLPTSLYRDEPVSPAAHTGTAHHQDESATVFFAERSHAVEPAHENVAPWNDESALDFSEPAVAESTPVEVSCAPERLEPDHSKSGHSKSGHSKSGYSNPGTRNEEVLDGGRLAKAIGSFDETLPEAHSPQGTAFVNLAPQILFYRSTIELHLPEWPAGVASADRVASADAENTSENPAPPLGEAVESHFLIHGPALSVRVSPVSNSSPYDSALKPVFAGASARSTGEPGSKFASTPKPGLAEYVEGAMVARDVATTALVPKLDPEAPAWSIVIPLLAWGLTATRATDPGESNEPEFAEGVPYDVMGTSHGARLTGATRGAAQEAITPKSNLAEMEWPLLKPAGLERESEPSLGRVIRLPKGIRSTEGNLLFGNLRRLKFHIEPVKVSPSKTAIQGNSTELLHSPPGLPHLHLEPITEERRFKGAVAFWTGGTPDSAPKKRAWNQAVDFWNNAPRDLKLLSIALPVLLGLALHPSLPKVRVRAVQPAVSQDSAANTWQNDLRAHLAVARSIVAERAGVELNEDFRAGLEEWQSKGDQAATWSFDQTGFVRPSGMALYRPSMALTDYEMQFLGLIDKKALNFVVRAQDLNNYYAVKLVVLKPGPLPQLGISRYAVINGHAEPSVQTKVPIDARADTLYRIGLGIHDDSFLLTVQGTVIDNWTEPRLKRGGIGFFSPQGEESRLRWVQVTHQYDMLGRLCAYLAPYTQTTNGSW